MPTIVHYSYCLVQYGAHVHCSIGTLSPGFHHHAMQIITTRARIVHTISRSWEKKLILKGKVKNELFM